MCGRFSLSTAEKQQIMNRFNLEEISIPLKPRYNIAPAQNIPIIRNDSPKTLNEAKWGLIPHWAKDEKIGYKMINARAETINEKPSYKQPFQKHRCLIIADSYYEWNKKGSTKTPYRIMMQDEDLFAFAGIFDIWNEKVTCSIVTTEPNKLMQEIHIRMPAILKKDKEQEWLSSSAEEALKLLEPYPSKEMKMYQISTLVNSPKNDLLSVIKADKSNLAAFIS